jgi:predicted butyrate kinase (DUF1464 family)
MEGIVKAVVTLLISAPSARDVVLSGRVAQMDRVRDDLVRRLSTAAPQLTVHRLRGFARVAKQGAQGAALIASGLAGGREQTLVTTMGVQRASGTLLDHLVFIDPQVARLRLGLDA